MRKRNYECLDCFFSCDTFDGMIIHRIGYGKGHKMSHYDKSYKYAVKRLIKTPSKNRYFSKLKNKKITPYHIQNKRYVE